MNFERIQEKKLKYEQNRHKISPITLSSYEKDFELTFTHNSTAIEGNTLTLMETKVVLEDGVAIGGKELREIYEVINHKKALEFIFENPDYFKTLTLKKIEELHLLLTNNLGVNKGLRKFPVGIVGTNYKPLDNYLQIKEAVEKLIEKINTISNPIEKALITVLMISYIQPFEDGNKRTGRILANSILFAHNYCPLSYRSISESEYKKAVIIFYENNSLDYFKKLFIEQFKFAVDKYF